MLLLSAQLQAADCTLVTWYRDADLDGYGQIDLAARRCWRSSGYGGWSRTGDDCDDGDPTIHPSAPDGCDRVDQDCDGGDNGCEEVSVFWGDLHTHTNLSQDGCEDADNSCLPVGRRPGSEVFDVAAERGLAFVAITDHAEVARYTYDGRTVDVWEAAQELVQDAVGGPVIPILGYEWTSPNGHRTILLEDDQACEDWRIPAHILPAPKDVLGLESYDIELQAGTSSASTLMERLAAVENAVNCEPTRYVAYYHHPAVTRPAEVDWASVAEESDTVVEIASEHGASECFDITAEGCDYRVREDVYDPAGSVQAALQLGLKLGFVGGTDGHDARPGSMDDGPSPIGSFKDVDGDGIEETARVQDSPGAVTGILSYGDLSRADVFSAIAARNTLASTWIFSGLRVYAYDRRGIVWLPGDGVPAADGPFEVHVELDDPSVEVWTADLVDPWGVLTAYDAPLDLLPGDLRYVRIQAWVDGEEQRVWASPFFAE